MPPSYGEHWRPAPRKWTVKKVGGTDPRGMLLNDELIFMGDGSAGNPFKLMRSTGGGTAVEWIPGATCTYDATKDEVTVTLSATEKWVITRQMVLTCNKQSAGLSWTSIEGG